MSIYPHPLERSPIPLAQYPPLHRNRSFNQRQNKGLADSELSKTDANYENNHPLSGQSLWGCPYL